LTGSYNTLCIGVCEAIKGGKKQYFKAGVITLQFQITILATEIYPINETT